MIKYTLNIVLGFMILFICNLQIKKAVLHEHVNLSKIKSLHSSASHGVNNGLDLLLNEDDETDTFYRFRFKQPKTLFINHIKSKTGWIDGRSLNATQISIQLSFCSLKYQHLQQIKNPLYISHSLLRI